MMIMFVRELKNYYIFFLLHKFNLFQLFFLDKKYLIVGAKILILYIAALLLLLMLWLNGLIIINGKSVDGKKMYFTKYLSC
jgi:hypothetical protein